MVQSRVHHDDLVDGIEPSPGGVGEFSSSSFTRSTFERSVPIAHRVRSGSLIEIAWIESELCVCTCAFWLTRV